MTEKQQLEETPKVYELKRIEDLLDIPEARFDEFLLDLKLFTEAARTTRDFLKTLAEATGEELPKDFITMRWVDDGKREGKVVVKQSPAKSKEKEE